MLGRIVYARLRQALLPDLRRAWSKDVDASVKTLQRELSQMQAELSSLRQAHDALAVKEWLQSRESLMATLDARLRVEPIRAHVLKAVDGAQMSSEPTTHAVVEHILPADFYELVNAAIPPPELFPARDPVKQDFHIDEHLATAPPHPGQGLLGFLVGDLCECPETNVAYLIIDAALRLSLPIDRKSVV